MLEARAELVISFGQFLQCQFSCYIIFAILEQLCIGALQINAIRIIGHMDWMDLGQHLGHHCGLGWIGFRKLDQRPTLRRMQSAHAIACCTNNHFSFPALSYA